LARGETRLVDAVVDVAIDERVDFVDLLAERRRIKVRCVRLLKRGELRLEVDRDVRIVVGHELLRDAIPDTGHSIPPNERWIGEQVRFRQKLEVAHGVGAVTVPLGKAPAVVIADGIDDRHRDRILEAEQPPHDDGAVGPRTRERHIQVIPPRLCGKARRAIRGDASPNGVLLANEYTIGADFRGKLALVRHASSWCRSDRGGADRTRNLLPFHASCAPDAR
jgi:hypothetical protein